MSHPSAPFIVRLTFGALVLAWGLVLAAVTIASLPYNPLSMSFSVEFGIRSLVPEGWGFFTREPRGLDSYLTERTGNQWKPLVRLPISHPHNLFGIDRRPRAIPVELAVLLDQVDEDDWHESKDDGDLLDAFAAVPVENPMEHPLLCGPLRVVSREPVPWAWFASGGDVEMPAWVVVLEVRCSHAPLAGSMS
jgi:antimicrobial peptide system SdpA family protein